MKILNKLTIRNLKLNKVRTLVAMFGIILATSLITVTIGLFSSLYTTLILHQEENSGGYHVVYYDITEEQRNKILNNKDVDSYYYINDLGYSISNLKDKEKTFLNVVAYNSAAFKGNKIHLIEGELPKNSNEIVIQKKMARYGFDKKVGDEITLDLISPEANIKGKLRQYENIAETDAQEETLDENEDVSDIISLVDKNDIKEQKYKIVGIISNIGYELEDRESIALITYDDKKNDYSSLYVRYKHPAKVVETVCNTILKDGNEKNQCLKSNAEYVQTDINYSFNNSLLEYYGIGLDSNVRTRIIIIVASIIAIISFCSIIIIKNSFSISVNERYKQYGMFSSIGATKKQLKRNVLFEGLIEGIFSIPIGILLGCGIVMGLVYVTNIILSNDTFLNDGYTQILYFNFPLVCIFIIALVSGITVYLSCLIPAIKISKVSPIEAIRNSGEIKIKKKKLKTSKIIKLFFGIGGVLADKNIKRNRKKYRTIVISLTISVILFICISAGIDILKQEIKNINKTIKYNFIFHASDPNQFESDYSKEDKQKFNKELLNLYEEKINSLKIEKYAYGYSLDINYDDKFSISSSYFNDDYFTYRLKENSEDYNNKNVPINVLVVNDDEYNRISSKYKVSSEDKASKAFLYSGFKKYTVSDVTDTKAFKEDKIDKLTVYYKEFIEENDNNHNFETDYDFEDDYQRENEIKFEEKNIDIEIIGEAFLEDALFDEFEYPTLIVSFDFKNTHEDLFKEYDVSELYIYDSDSEKIINNLENLDSEYKTYLINISEEINSLKNIVLIMSIFMYTFIVIITLISITNIFNTISTSMMLRKKEFAILRSMGMSDKEFNRMIILESILYSIKALIYGLIISIILLYLFYASENNSTLASNITFLFKNLPYTSIIYSIAITIIVILSTMLYSLSKINKQNIIETIRSDNI